MDNARDLPHTCDPVGPPIYEEPLEQSCIVQFAGGHSSLFRNTNIRTIFDELKMAREEALDFVYLQPGDRPANSVVVDPKQVVAVVVKY